MVYDISLWIPNITTRGSPFKVYPFVVILYIHLICVFYYLLYTRFIIFLSRHKEFYTRSSEPSGSESCPLSSQHSGKVTPVLIKVLL